MGAFGLHYGDMGSLHVLHTSQIYFEKWVPLGVPTWVPDRVPICTRRGIRGPEGARKEKNIMKWNRANMGALHPKGDNF